MYIGKTLCAQANGVYAVDELYPHCGALWGRQGSESAQLRRTISRHGLRATDLAREFARYRSVPFGQSGQALPHGTAHHRASLDPGRCQLRAQLAVSIPRPACWTVDCLTLLHLGGGGRRFAVPKPP